ncbi:MAG: NADH-quinone oxidoreductase subunit NuoB, partial [Candidatus Methanospirareceae archaeon]
MKENISIVNSGLLAPLRRWGTKWSLWPVHFVTACCGVELAHAFASGYDGERIGALNYGIARQTNLIIVEGAITRKMARALRVTWEQMPDPKFVFVIGACGEKGGIFWNGYNMVCPADVVPVDFFVPGCPVTPEGLLRGIRAIQEKIEGRNKTTIEWKRVELPRGTGEERKKAIPTSPKIIAPTPLIKIDIERKEEWGFGEELVENLKEELKGLYKRISIIDRNRIAIRTTAEDITKIAEKLREKGFDHVKSVNVIDVPHEKRLIVEYIVSSYSVKELKPVLVTIFADINRGGEESFPSLSSYWENADYLERELHDLFGVRFEGNKGMDSKLRFILAPDAPKAPLRKDFKLEEERYAIEEEGEAPAGISTKPPKELVLPISEDFLEDVYKSDNYVVLVGPQHPGSGHFWMIVRLKGDIIVEVVPDPGYVHRCMEKLAENRLYIQNIPLFERASINDPINMTLGYVRAIERAMGVEVPERAKYIRTIMAELSRMGAFFYDAGILAIMVGHSTGFMYGFAIREIISEAMTKISGARMTPSFIVPGGIRRDVPDDVLDWIKSSTDAILKRLEKLEHIFINNPVTVARTKNVGVLTREEAIKYGIVGPFLRASGVEYDVRKEEPYEAYDELEWDIPVCDAGDALARFLVRVEEVRQSSNIIRQAVDAVKKMPKGNILSEDILGEF